MENLVQVIKETVPQVPQDTYYIRPSYQDWEI